MKRFRTGATLAKGAAGHFGHAYLVETAIALWEVADGQTEQPDLSAAAGEGYGMDLVGRLAREMRTKIVGLTRTLVERFAQPPGNG